MAHIILLLFLSFSFTQTLFFSEYAEGSSNHKYLEIYNPTSESVDLTQFGFPNSTNGADVDGEYDYWNSFDSGSSVSSGDVFVICHPSADPLIQGECDQHHTYLSNGNDGFCIVEGTESSYTIIDCIGTWNSEDPGDGWEVAGISNGTKDHTLVRKGYVTTGNGGDWTQSAGTNEENSEWEVYDQNTWDYLGYHNEGGSSDDGGGTTNDGLPVSDAGSDQVVDYGADVVLDGSNSYDTTDEEYNIGTIQGYSWVQESGPIVDADSYTQAILSFVAPDDFCVIEFSLQVYDDDFNSSEMDFISITVGGQSIYDIQFTAEQGEYCYETTMSQSQVSVTGVVTHVKPSGQFFIQDFSLPLWGGIYVYDYTVLPQVGDELALLATVNEYYSLTQLIDVTSATVISSGNDIFITSVNASDVGIACSLSGEELESMLVEIENVTFDSVDEFGNWTVSDQSGTTMIDDYYFDDSSGSWPNISTGNQYDCISGIVSYSYSEFKIYPRNINDFECSSNCSADGDVNQDNNIDVLDIVFIVGYILGNNSLNENQMCVTDMNVDGSVDVLDVVSIVNSILETY